MSSRIRSLAARLEHPVAVLGLALLCAAAPIRALGPIAATSDDGRVYAARADATGAFSGWTQLADFGSGTTRGVALGHFDEDVYPDILSGRNSGNEIVFFKFPGRPDGGFDPPRRVGSLAGSSGYLMDMASADFNGDGVEDFAANTNSNVVGFFLSDGAGGFTPRTANLETGSGRGLDAGDFNEDGRADLVRARCCDGLVSLYLGDGAGGFAFARTVGDAGGDPYGVAAADFDGDGDLDVLANEGGSGDPTLFRGNGDGTFAAGVRPVGGDVNNYSAYDAFDYNGDGRADLLAVSYSGQRAWSMTGMGNGNFGPAVEIAPPSGPGNLLGVAALPYPHPRAPLVSLSPARVEVALGTPVAFDASGSTAPVGLLVSREWLWDDGTAGTGALADHTYADKGRYWILHRARADNGLSGTARALAVVTGPPPRAEAGGPYVFGEAQARNGIWTGQLDGTGTTGDGGADARYVWNLMPDLTFAEDFSAPLDPAKWRSAFSTVADGTLRVGSTSGGDWGAAHLASQANFARRPDMAFHARFRSHGAEHVMFGFKNTSANQHYWQLQYAFYVSNGNLYIYENGSNRGHVRAVPYGTWHDFKIEIRDAGADYWYRPGGSDAWERVHQSTYAGAPELKVAISGYFQGRNEFDDLYLGRKEEGRRLVAGFRGPAVHNVILSVTDFQGQVSTDSATVTTAVAAAPVARTGGPYLFGEAAALNGQWVARLDGTGSADDHGIAEYHWDFGDGTTGTGAQPTHAYAGTGPYVIRLTVKDHGGLTHADEGVVQFRAGNPPVAAFAAPEVADESRARNGQWTVPFDASATTDDFGIWRYEWAFGNGTTGSGRTVNGTYGAMGAYTATLTAFDHAGQRHTAQRAVQVTGNALPVPRITAPARVGEDSARHQRWRVAFSSAASTDDFGLWRFEWNFGDGATSTAAAPLHQYGATGTYTVTLRAFDHAGQSQTASHAVEVAANAPPVARIAASPTTAEGLRPVAFDASPSTDDFGISRYDWDFGSRTLAFDGTAIDPLELVVSAGVIQDGRVIVTGTSAWGPRFAHSAREYQRKSELQARVRTPSGTASHHAMVGFKNSSGGTSYTDMVHAIYFDNGNLSVYENGSSRGGFGTYVRGGEYEVRIVSKAAGADYYLRRVGEASFRLLHSSTGPVDNPLLPGMTVHSGAFELDDLAVHARAQGPLATAVFQASARPLLTVTDHGGQTDTQTVDITVVRGAPPTAAIDAPAEYGTGLEVPLSARRSADDYGIARYEWDFGDGTARALGERVGHHFASPGVYTVRLTVTDHAGQSATAAHAINITGTGLVRAVPWRFNNNIEVPHETWSGKEVTLTAGAHTARLPLTWTWDFGDGSPTVSGTAATEAQAYGIEARHAYAGSHGTPYVATISIVDATGARASDTYPLILKDRTLTVETNVAIDEALWYLHKNQTRSASGGDRLGFWPSRSGLRTNSTASAVQAFEINGHTPLGDPAHDPYVETVRRGLDGLFTLLAYANIGPQSHGDPDQNANGIGIGGTEADQPYQMGAVMDALIASGAPDLVARTGGVNVRGRRYRDLLQDMADMYAWGQEDAGWAQGGWRYSWHGGSDNSAAQWAAIGLIPAEKLWGIRVPAFVKEQNRVWTDASYLNQPTNCGYGYTGPSHSHELTPSGLVQVAFQGALGRTAQWDCAERRMDREWTAFINANTTYGYYAFTKAMRLAHPAPVVNLRGSGRDWFNDDPGGLRRTLVGRQRADGSWLSSHTLPQEPLINTAWTTIILTPTLFENPPVALIHASPNPGAVGQPVRFDAGQSYHLDPFRKVVSYAWDFDASDGVDWSRPDATGPVVQHAFGSLRSYTVSLRVGDDQDPAHYDVATARVDITIPPHPPTAVPGGPYVAAVGEAVALDASGSFDIDRAQGDSITAYGWEIDFQNPRDFDDALGVRPTGVRFNSAGTFNVGLRVTDNTAQAFPQAGRPNLTHDAFTTVQVQSRCLDNLSVRMKETMVALTWTHDGSASYTVLRSTVSPSFGFREIGRTSSTYSTFVDYNVEINRTYYYRVQSARDCGSYAVSIVPRYRSTNRRPVITSQAVPTAVEGQAYAYDVQAADPDGTALTYLLDQAPSGMTINAANGLIGWTPTFAQVGQHPIAVRVTDGVMSAVQAWILTVSPRPNLPPVARIAGPTAGLTGQALVFDGSGSSDPEGDAPLTYAWSFGDGGTATGPGASHAYGAAGTFVVTLFVTDARGATGTVTRTVVVEAPNRAPIARAGGPYLTAVGDTLVLDGSASADPDGDSLRALWHFGDDTDPVAGLVARHVYAAEGTYQASLEVQDGRGGIGTATVSVVVGPRNHAPEARIVASGSFANPGDEIAFDATSSTDPDGDAMTFAWDFGDRSGTTGDLVTHVYTAPGRYLVTLTATDARGRTDTAQVSVHVNAPPVLHAMGPMETLEDAPFLHEMQATDADGHALTYALVQGPAGLAVEAGTGRVFWQPGNDAVGEHAVRIRAADGFGGFAESAFRLRVVNVNDPPVITSAPVSSVEELTAYRYLVTAADVDAGDRLSYALSLAPAGMTIDPLMGLVSWSPGHDDLGDHPITVLAIDAAGAAAEQTFTLTVTERPWAPEFTSTHPPGAVEDSLLRYQATARDLNAADVLAFSLEEGPAGMAVEPATGILTWTPDNSQVGSHAVRIRVSDGTLSADQAFNLSVANTNDAPAIVSTAPAVAVVGEAYAYPVQAVDVDAGDSLAYRLLAGSGNAALDSATGALSWTPSEAEVGERTFRVSVTDAAGLAAEQAFVVRVQRVPEPPAFTLAAPPAATQGVTYSYQAAAEDPNGDPLIFSLVAGPAGMAVTPTGLVTFTPGPDQVGSHAVRIAVTDGRFTVEQAYTLTIANVNDDPEITSVPKTTAMDGITYTYQVVARDADGDALAYALERAPEGMSVSATGLVSWPDSGDRPDRAEVELAVTDGQGGRAVQAWSIAIVADDVPPTVAIRLSANPIQPGQFVTITVEATDNVGVASRSLVVDGSPVVLVGGQYQYQAAAAGEVSLEAAAVDLNGNSGSASRTLTVSRDADATAPRVILSHAPASPAVGEVVTFSIAATDAGGIDPERVWLLIDGVYVPVENGTARFTPLRRGTYTALATAYDLAGNYGSASTSFSASVPGSDATAPTAGLTGPTAHTDVTGRVDILGTAQDANFAYYTLSYRPEGSSETTEFHQGTAPVTSGVLGTFDGTVVENGDYQVILTVYDRYGNASSRALEVSVSGERKVGNFTLAFQDMTFTLSGINLEATRTYDSRVKVRRDFGVGWTLDLRQSSRVVEHQDPATGWRLVCKRSLFGTCLEWGTDGASEHRVTVHIPGYPKQEFELETRTDFAQPSGLAQGSLAAKARPGTVTTLTPLAGHHYDFFIGGELLDMDFNPVNPTRYRLTLVDGTQYVIDEGAGGVVQIADANGNRVDIGSNAITHSDGTSIALVRDGQGRITRIQDPAGRRVEYDYDGHGNLRSVTDPNGNVTRFKYDSRHLLTDILDPRGIRGMRTEFDESGRMVRQINAKGEVIAFGHDEANGVQTMTDPEGNETRFTYDAKGNVTSKADPEGRTWTYAYDAQGRLLETRNPDGTSTRAEYDAAGNQVAYVDAAGNRTATSYNAFGYISARTDRLGRQVRYDYDSRGNMTREVGPDGTAQRVKTYDAQGNMLSEADALGNATTYAYSAGRPTAVTDPLGRTKRYTYDDRGKILTETDAKGNVKRYTYDAKGNKLSETDALGNVKTWTYTSFDKVLTETDARGNVTRRQYDAVGEEVVVIHPDGSVTRKGYDGNGNVSLEIDALGREKRTTYDEEGRPLEIVHPDGSVERNEYDALGRRTASVDPLGRRTEYQYDAEGRNALVRTAVGQVFRYEYDAEGNRTAMLDAAGRRTEYAYDAYNRLIRTRYPDGTASTLEYDAAGRKITETDQAGRRTRYEYDAADNLVRVIEAAGGVTEYAYDENNNRVSQRDARGNLTSFAYDALNRLITKVMPGGGRETYEYDAHGNLTRKILATGEVMTFAYDAMNREIRRTYGGSGRTVATAYLADGQKASVTDHRGRTAYAYDARGRLGRVENPDGTWLAYAYDAAGNKVRTRMGRNGTEWAPTEFAYDAANRLVRVDHAGMTAEYAYDANGNRLGISRGNGVSTEYEYDALNRLVRVVNRSAGGPALSSFRYTLDPAGYRTRVEEMDGSVVDYAYDGLYRLTEEVRTGSSPYRIAYAYDAVGNRLSKDRDGAVTTYEYDADDRLQREIAPDGTITYAYDAAGRLVEKAGPGGTVRYAWEDMDRLAGIEGAGLNVAYEYDAEGRRVAETVGGNSRRFLFDATLPFGQVIADYAAGDAPAATYGYGLDRISRSGAGTGTHVYLADGQGSVRQLADASGIVTDTYAFTAFGEILSKSGSTPNDFLYTGEQYDPNAGFYYLRARWMDPALGRFLSLDPHPGDPQAPVSLHRYLYANASPLNFTDPTGEISLGGVISVANAMVRVAISAIRPAFMISRAMGGAALRNLGLVVERAVRATLIRVLGSGAIRQQGITLVGAGGRRVIDFWLQIGQRVAYLEVKYKLPSQVGSALTRLVGQMRTAISASQATGAQVVLFTWRAPTAAEMTLLLTQLGPQASSIQMVHGLWGLAQWARLFFLL